MVVLLPCLNTCFCFSCQQFCSILHRNRSRVPRFWRIGTLRPLLPAKIRKTSSMPPVEQWEQYVVPNHSRFPANDEKHFLSGTRVTAALDKVGSPYLGTELRRAARRFLQEIVICVLLTVASRSVIGQGMSCFCPAIVVCRDDIAPFQFFNKLLDGLLEKGWTRGSADGACRAEYQSFVQLERSSASSRSGVDDVLSFCSAQAGFRARQYLYKVCIVSNQTCCADLYELFCFRYVILLFQAFQLTNFVFRGPATHREKCLVCLNLVTIKKEEVRGVLLCV